MKLCKSILFWAALACGLFLSVRGILSLGGFTMRAWLRESATILIGAGLAAGVLQLCLLPKKIWLKILLIVLWVGGTGFFCVWGYIQYAFLHPEERHYAKGGKDYLVEVESAFGSYSYSWYEEHGLFVRGSEEIYTSDPYSYVDGMRAE